jgi:hypothetical protein
MEFSLLDWPERTGGVNVLLPCAEWALCGAILLLVQAIWQAQLGIPNQNERKKGFRWHTAGPASFCVNSKSKLVGEQAAEPELALPWWHNSENVRN